jgi:hypothetical protein
METQEDMILRDLNFRRKYLHRKFYDNTYRLHGRFYGGYWEGLPSEWRQRLTINGKLTSEIDFTNMHFAILYHEIGEKMTNQGDLYDLSETVPEWKGLPIEKLKVYRKQVKLIMNYMINCEDDEQVKGVIEKNRKKIFTRTPKGFTWQGLIDFIKEIHSPIADKFYRNQGIRLMNLDSQILEKVILKGIDNDVCVLGVHDSCIFKHEHQHKVMTWMVEAYEEVVGKYGKTIKWDIFRLDHLQPLADLQDKDISSYLLRLQEWNIHRQSYGDSSLPLLPPMP